ncbi:MAG TPA: RNase adapter RapZ, partial [Polyangiaceae bacterium]|nr:RNase adapter RapZ [Polyangiaceae bacterium]
MSARDAVRATANGRPTVVVVSGLSGAGKSQALHALEDLGFFCVDNLPTLLAPQAVALCEQGGMTRVALGIDVRVRAFLGEVGNVLQLLEASGHRELHVLFLDASDETLLHRFSETRRPHPMSRQGTGAEGALAVLDGVRVERERLAPLRARAT